MRAFHCVEPEGKSAGGEESSSSSLIERQLATMESEDPGGDQL